MLEMALPHVTCVHNSFLNEQILLLILFPGFASSLGDDRAVDLPAGNSQ
jgi:hypothetical protein